MYTYSHLEDYIRNKYREVGIGHPSQLNMFWIADQLDIGLYLKRDKSEAIYSYGRYYIFLDRSLTHQQRWQEFAHELCHILRHDGHQGSMEPMFRELQEWQANNFAFHFCVPTFMLEEIDLPNNMAQSAGMIAKIFGVEYSFAERRIEQYYQKIGGFVWRV